MFDMLQTVARRGHHAEMEVSTQKLPCLTKGFQTVPLTFAIRKHVLKDIRPYSCLFPDCTEPETTFSSRKEWQNHEWKNHRPQKLVLWRCGGCPSGAEKSFDDKSELLNHMIQDHLDGNTSFDLAGIADRFQVQTSKVGLRQKIQCPFCPDMIV